jgi:hypothetical protein
MNYKDELQKYLSSSNINTTNINNTIINKTQLDESELLPPRKYNKVVEECLNFEEVNTKKVNILI